MPAAFSEDDISKLRIALSRTVRELDRRSNEEGLTRTQLTVLGQICRLKQVPLAELAELESVNPTMLSRLIGKLEAAGLVSRVADEKDRRVAHVKITPAGRKIWEHSRSVRTRVFTGLLAQLPQPEAAALLAALPALEALADISRPVAR